MSVALESRGESLYDETSTPEPNAERSLETGVTAHPLTVRVTVDGAFEDVSAYEWHGCRADVITVDSEPTIASGCYDD